MNQLGLFLPLCLGALTVLQAGLNRRISGELSLSTAVLMNAFILMITALALWFYLPKPSSEFAQKFSWWFLLPGLMGLSLVYGGPLSIQKFGAVITFVLIISAQLLVSFIWDLKVENLDWNWMRALGVSLAWLGAFIAIWGSR